MNEEDQADEVADFSTLLGKTKKRGEAPKRGSKNFAPDNTPGQQAMVDKSREVLFELVGETKPLAAQHSIGVLTATDNNHEPWITTILQKKGTHYQYMGHSFQGNMVLYLEEAAWLMNRRALCIYSKPESALKATTSKSSDLTGISINNNDDTILTFEDFCSFMFASKDGWITFEKYQVYAYLKRLGYNVQRSTLSSQQQNIVDQSLVSSPATARLTSWKQNCKSFFGMIWHRFVAWIHTMSRSIGLLSTRPLIRHYECRQYNSVYSRLKTISSTPWYLGLSPEDQDASKPFYTVTWDVYKPNPKWKKRDPGIPDYRVVVGNMNDPLPSPSNLNYLFSQLYGLPYKHDAYRAIRNTQSPSSHPAFLIGLVGNAEGVSFLRLQGDGISDIVLPSV
ncbi:uncharacterized protein BX664DRAFT_358489 [Halteromyces radiatus]|uniref:uncharacterized protein n=1 Tax=Halteromyces radiatus TaxID=101107 RepID=UPI002220DBDB|nr:uncharacterized protein BX664DRAFT_358489 [Halteromyces radiatus]KAI8088856.1 hypothetical protein BX664DRAFT_358489 [Halteromyces radiatus]